MISKQEDVLDYLSGTRAITRGHKDQVREDMMKGAIVLIEDEEMPQPSKETPEGPQPCQTLGFSPLKSMLGCGCVSGKLHEEMCKLVSGEYTGGWGREKTIAPD